MEDFAFLAVQNYISKAATQSYSMARYDHSTIGGPVVNCRRKLLCFRRSLDPSSHPSRILHRLHLGRTALLVKFTHDTNWLLSLAIPRAAESLCHSSAEDLRDYDVWLTGDDESLH
jgi:hypothetical protein